MRIGVFDHGWWSPACTALGHEAIPLPVAPHASGNAYMAGLEARLANSEEVLNRLQARPADVLLDNGGTGLGFVTAAQSDGSVDLLHERTGKLLLTQFVDPINTALQGLDWHVVWQSLSSGSWVKAVWDRAHALELQRFHIPNVMHLPMAAPLRAYDTSPLDPRRQRPVVSFVGGQNTTFFRNSVKYPTSELLAGVAAQCVQSDLPQVSFFDTYHDFHGFGPIPAPSTPGAESAQRAAAYFSAKLFYNAVQCIRQRDRFVIFLKRKLGDWFRLIGRDWDTAYGLPVEPPLPTADQYFSHFRESAINLNLVNGNAESGLNMRHFEITAAGGFMLCYRQPELEECFEVGKECVVFTSEQDLLEKIQYFLSHPEERIAIAAAGQRRTLGEHLYSHRLVRVLQAVRPMLAGTSTEFSNGRWQDDCSRVVPTADIILDCGANVGQMAAGFRKLYPAATIYCFEPVQAALAKLRVRAEELNVRPVGKAVGDFDGPALIHLTAGAEAHSLLGFQEGNPCSRWTQIVGSEPVEVCTLDRWCAESRVDPRRVSLIKLDIQGSELKALYGARGLLKTVPLVLIEVSFVPLYKDAPLIDDIERFMTECGYRQYALYPSDQPDHWGDALYVKS